MSMYDPTNQVKAYTGGPYATETGPESAIKTPEVDLIISELNKETDQLLENLAGLVARLEIVMTPDLPSTLNKDGVPPVNQPHSNAYNRINDIRYKIVGANILISKTEQRLEV